MVITSSTQWTIPLASTSSPSLTKHGPVLGLKSCHLSPPSPSSIADLDDLHTSSSRRLQAALLGADIGSTSSSRRSAGSFRQLLISEDNLASWGLSKSHLNYVDAPYDGIAMPWSSVHYQHQHHHHFDAATVVNSSINPNVAELHGDITADDVDLLPIPGLMTCSSPCYDAFFAPHSSKVTEIASPQSSANSSKSSLMVPNHLGLPPNFNVEVENMSADEVKAFTDVRHVRAQPVMPSASREQAKCTYPDTSVATIGMQGKETDTFINPLTDLWINCDANNMLHDSESLASIFNVFPQQFHGLETEGYVDIRTDMTQSNELHFLVASSRGEKGQVNESLQSSGDPANRVSRMMEEKGMKSTVWEGIQEMQKGIHVNTMQPGIVSEAKNAHTANAPDTSVLLSDISFVGSMDTASSVEKMVGMKRPFSMLHRCGIAPSMTESVYSSTTAWPFQLDTKLGLPSLTGLNHHITTQHSTVSFDDEVLPKSPPPKVRRRHGTAMDPQSVAARSRREKFSDRIRILQSLIPNGERLDTVSMLGQTLEYVRFLQHQVSQLYHGKDPVASLDSTCEKWKDFIEAERGSAG